MVFSINSRYALQRVQWIPSTSYLLTCLKATERTVSTKGPTEDISKPPLRLNIPKDSQCVEPYTKLIKSAQPRSRSLISKSSKSFTSGIENDLLCKSGSEMNFSSFRQNEGVDQNGNNPETSKNVSGIEYSDRDSENAYYQTVHHCSAKEESDSKKESINNAGEQSGNEMCPDSLGKETGKVDNSTADDESRNLYIMIDAPEKAKEKQFAYVSTCEPSGQDLRIKLPSFTQDDFEAVKSVSGKTIHSKPTSIKVSKKKHEGVKGKASLTKFSTPKGEKGKSNSKVKFHVHEIDDTSTYVFQLKFKKGLQGRTCAVGCVPEREVNTRRMDMESTDEPVPFCSGPECRNKPLKETPFAEDHLQHTKYPDWKAKGKSRKENSDVEKSKSNTTNAVRSHQNSSGLSKKDRDGNDEVTGSVCSQPLYSAGEDSYSQNYKVREKDETQPEDQSSAQVRPAPQAQPYESNATAETVSYSAVGEESVDNQNSKVLQTSHESDNVYATYNTVQSQTSDSSQVQFSEGQPQEAQPNPENPTTTNPERRDKDFKPKTGKSRKHDSKTRSIKRTPSGVKCEAYEPETTDFQTTTNVVSIQSERPPTPPKYSAGLPKFVNKTFKAQRKGFGIIEKDSMFGRKWSHRSDFDVDKGPAEIIRNPLFYSTKETDEVNSSLFRKKDDILHVYKGKTTENSPKMADNLVNVANENLTEDKGKASVDSLAMMKQLKEMVDFDLKNAVKIFGGRESQGKVSKVDEMMDCQEGEESCEKIEEKSKTIKSQNQDAAETTKVDKPEVTFDGPKETACMNQEPVPTFKYLPGRRENEGGILDDRNSDSVIHFDSETEKFAINFEELEMAIHHSRENFEEIYLKAVCQGLDKVLSEEIHVIDVTSPVPLELKSGDSILVFDEMTQTWKVDFSIIEKRKEQMKEEEELTRRSEIILETIEKLEQGNISNIPKPSTRDKRTFDYNKEEWKTYRGFEKGQPVQKSSKSKLPFKESDAEEIRKRNSDLYEDLFIANKKDADLTKDVKDTSDTTNPKKIGKSADGQREVMMAFGSKKTEEPCKGDKKEESAKEDKKDTPPKEEKKETPPKEDKNETPPKEPCKDDPSNKPEDKEVEEEGWEAYIKEDIPALSSIPRSAPGSRPTGKLPTIPPNIKKIDPTGVKVPPMSPDITKIPPSKITPPGKPGIKIDEPKFRIPLPFGRKKKIDEPQTKPSTTEKAKIKDGKEKVPPIPSAVPGKPEVDSKVKPVQSTTVPDSKTTLTKEPPKGLDPKPQAPTTPAGAPKGPDSKPKPPPLVPPSHTPKTTAPSTPTPVSAPPKVTDPNAPPTALSSKLTEDPKSEMASSSGTTNKEHYVSDNIVEMSKTGVKDKNLANKSKQLETVKLNITSNTRTPSKITEINLNKKLEEKAKEVSSVQTSPETKNQSNSIDPKKTLEESKNNEKCSIESRTFYRNFEKYKTPFSDPDFEEKSVKINSDMESNPNLKKLDNWNKTLVLHDTMKPSENVESWLKDETDKMATLLLKVLQEAADGKPKRKPLSPKAKQNEKATGKANPYDHIRKKQETTPDGFLFKARTVSFAVGGDGKSKPGEQSKSEKKTDQNSGKEIPVQSGKTAKSAKVVEVLKVPDTSVSETSTGSHLTSLKDSKLRSYSDILLREPKSKLPDIALDDMNSPWVGRDVETKLNVDLSDDIPGPEILKKISGTWKIFPVIGCQATIFTLLRIFQLVNLGTSFWNSLPSSKSGKNAFSKLFTKYGPIVNLQGPLSGSIVLMHKPEHLSGVFEQDTGCSVRSVFDSLEQSRREAENKILTVGISTDWSKMEWNELKKASNDPLVRGCEKFFRPVEVAGESLISNIRRNRNNQNLVSDDFMKEIKQWSLEGLCSVLFEKSFGFLEGRSNNASWLLEPEKFFCVIEETTEYLSKCERGFQAWRLMSTPSSLNLNQAYRSLYTILSKQLYQAELNLKNKNELLKDNSFIGSHDLTFLESMLLNDRMTVEDVICNVIDFLLIGVNTMSSALGFMLYNLAQNTKVQNKLLKEVKEMLPDKTSRLDYHKLHSLKYLQACLKESLRLNSPVPLFFRVLQNDVMVSNYVIPKESYVVMDLKYSNMREQVFEGPEKFMPERWLNDEKWVQDMNPLSSIPFCHGPRAELARRVVEMQLWSCIARVVRNFQIEYHYGEIQGTENIFSHPDKPLKLNFVERDE